MKKLKKPDGVDEDIWNHFVDHYGDYTAYSSDDVELDWEQLWTFFEAGWLANWSSEDIFLEK